VIILPFVYSAHVGVIGGGLWGLALAAAAARSKTKVYLHSRRDLKGRLPDGVEQVPDIAHLAKRSRLIVLTVPSGVVDEVARTLGDSIDGRHLVVHGIRGLASNEMEPISHVIRRETPARRLGALGGPVLSEDLIDGKPSVLVCGSHYPEVNAAIISAFGSPVLRVYDTNDLIGVEWASALVGCLAVGIGYAQALGLNAGILATVTTRAVEEAARIAAAAGGNERTLLGIAGYGDLLASISQADRPEVVLGRALAQGRSLEQAIGDAKLRVEAVDLIPRIATWSEQRGVRAPIFRALRDGMLAGRAPDALVSELMAAPPQKAS
jgi:glycerol-3-phosphate dehydrogenase (NAD(P)+)